MSSPELALSDNDRIIAQRKSVPIPKLGQVLDAWVALSTPLAPMGKALGLDRDVVPQSPFEPPRTEDPSVTARERGHSVSSIATTASEAEEHAKQLRGSGAAARITARWVPLYAAPEAVRQVRLSIELAGLGISVIDSVPRVSVFSYAVL